MKFQSIKTQLTVIYTAVIIFLIICVSVVAENLSSNALINKSILSANRELRMLNEKVEMFAENIEMVSLYLIQVQNSDSFNEPYENFLYTSGILSFLQDFVFTHPTVASISFYDTQGTVLFSDTKSNFAEISDEPNSYIEEFEKEDRNTKWLDFHYFRNSSSEKEREWGCSFLRKVYSYTGEFLGVFELNISEKSIQSIYDIALADHYSFYLLNEDQMVVSAKDKDMLRLSLEELQEVCPPDKLNRPFHSGSSYLYSTHTNEKMGWTLVSTIPVQEILKETQKLVMGIFSLGVVAIILAFFLLNRISKFITRPLVGLTSAVEQIAGGDYQIRADADTPNEIGRLADRVNQMAENTQNLLRTIERESALKRQLELSYIQLQMNPHFLYNTLESICGMIAVDEKKKAIKVIQNLSAFYRKILTRGAPIVTLEQEMEITRCYLEILRQRYCEAYTYEIRIDPEAASYYVPKLTFQPFVENALIHGILPAGRPGHIGIVAQYRRGHLEILISDNGRGMDKQVMERLKESLRQSGSVEEKENGFGVVNTFRRLSLFLNEPDIEMVIDSAEDSGTQIRMILPAEQKEHLQKEIDSYHV